MASGVTEAAFVVHDSLSAMGEPTLPIPDLLIPEHKSFDQVKITFKGPRIYSAEGGEALEREDEKADEGESAPDKKEQESEPPAKDAAE